MSVTAKKSGRVYFNGKSVICDFNKNTFSDTVGYKLGYGAFKWYLCDAAHAENTFYSLKIYCDVHYNHYARFWGCSKMYNRSVSCPHVPVF